MADHVAKLVNDCGDRFDLLPIDPDLGRTAFGDLTSHWQLALYVGLINGVLKQKPGPDPMFFDRALSWLRCFIDVRTALDTESRRCNAICSIGEYLETLVRTGFLVIRPWE